jgi:hypothetical protein
MFESKVLSAIKDDGVNLTEFKIMARMAKELGANAKSPVEVSLEQLAGVLVKIGLSAKRAKEVAQHFEGRYLCSRPPWFDVIGFGRNGYLKFTPRYMSGPDDRLSGYHVSIDRI